MKILIVRHGDPDYSIDGLTEKGKREVQLLADRLCREDISALYCSPLGRAKLTAAPTAERLGITPVTLDWLREFSYAEVELPYSEKPSICWDLLPEFVEAQKNIYSSTDWTNDGFIKNSTVPTEYANVCKEFDALLARHGYERCGYGYKAVRSNHDTVVLVCHFGLSAVLLSHIMNCSPYSIWQNLCTPPTSVTTVYTEERAEGIAQLRISSIGDTSHLYAKGEPIAFAGRYCECFADDTRH